MQSEEDLDYDNGDVEENGAYFDDKRKEDDTFKLNIDTLSSFDNDDDCIDLQQFEAVMDISCSCGSQPVTFRQHCLKRFDQ